MADDSEREGAGVLGSLLTPLRLPVRLVADIEALRRSVQSLQATVQRHLPPIDDNAATLVTGIGEVQETLVGLEAALEKRLEALRQDFNERILAVEDQVRAMQPTLGQMARDIQKVNELLPEPNDGPLTRLKDTLTSN